MRKKLFFSPILVTCYLLFVTIPVLWLQKDLVLHLPLFNFLSVTSIKCKTQYGPCGDEDLKLAEKFIGKNILTLQDEAVQDELLTNFRNEKVHIQKILPQTLFLSLEKRKAILAVQKESMGDGAFLVASNNIVLSFEKNPALPTILLEADYPNPVVGQKVDDNLVKAGKLLLLIKKVQTLKKSALLQGTLHTWIDVQGREVEILLPQSGDEQVLIGALQPRVESDPAVTVGALQPRVESDPAVTVGALQLILEKSKMENKIPAAIDLRYKNPVLTY